MGQSRPTGRRQRRGNSSRRAVVPEVVDVPNAHPSTLEKLRQLLVSSGYLELGIDPGNDEEIASGTPLNTLARLFHGGDAVAMREAAEVLSPLTIEQLVKAGFLRSQGQRVLSKILIQAHDGLLFALPIEKSEHGNTVMLVSPSSRELHKIMVRRPSRNTLDLGTGCGFLAMLAARHSERVFAVDLNPRAIRFAQFNCRWNRIQNVTCLQGNGYEPVRDQRFDQIVSNPPFVISPASRLMYRDSGVDGDAFCIQLARDAAQLLNEGGYFQMIFQWIETAGTDWRDHLLRSFSSIGCDVWILRVQADSPGSHVRSWIKEGEAESLSSRWMEYLARREAASVGTGFCIMKRVLGGDSRVWFDEAPEECSEAYGDAVADIFSMRRHLEECSDRALLQERFAASPHLRLVQRSSPKGNAWQTTASELLLDQGLKYVFGDVDQVLAGLASACDGHRTIQQVFEIVAQQNRRPAQELISSYLPLVRELARYAFLVSGGAGNRSRSD